MPTDNHTTADQVKHCNGCNRDLPLDQFWKRSGRPTGQARCKACMGESSRMWERNHPERRRELALRYYHSDPLHSWGIKLKSKFNMTVEDYKFMLASQGGVCAICLKPPGSIRLHVDHDHATGIVRGLLCVVCNSGLEKFNDSTDKIDLAVDLMGRYESAQ